MLLRRNDSWEKGKCFKRILISFEAETPRSDRVGARNVLIFGRPEPGLHDKWGSAAWTQTQLTPGVSVLAASPPFSRSGKSESRKGT